jgi:hypothetical protein
VKRLILLILCCASLASAQTRTFIAEDNLYTIATLPPPATTLVNLVVIVTDAVAAGNCASGGGSARAFCQNTGSAWISLGGSGGGTTNEVNGTPNATQAVLNIQNSTANVTGLAQVCTNPSAGNVKCEITGNTPGIDANTIYAASYGALFNGRECFGATSTVVFNGTSTVTCNTAQFCNNSTVICAAGRISDVGKQVAATSGCCGVQQNWAGVSLMASPSTATTITAVNSATSATLSQNVTSCSGGTCVLAWATNDDVAISAAETAAAAVGRCPSIVMPGGLTAILKSHFTSLGANCNGAQAQDDYSEVIRGAGIGVTVLGIFPGFDWTTCPSGECFGGPRETTFVDWQINGFGWGNTGSPLNTTLVEGWLGSQWSQWACNGVGGSDTNLTGLGLDSAGWRGWGISVDGCGYIGVRVGGNINKVYYCFFGDNLGPALQFEGNSDFTDFGCDYGGQGGTSVIYAHATGTQRYDAESSTFFGCAQGGIGGSYGLNMGTGGNVTFIIHNSRFACTSPTSHGLYTGAATNKAYLQGASIIGGTTDAIVRDAGTIYTDPGVTFPEGTITAIAPTCASTGLSQTACSTLAGSTNEKGAIKITAGVGASTSGTVTLTFAGAFSGPSGAAPTCTFQYDNRGTGVWAAPVALMTDHTGPTTSAYIVDWAATAPTNTDIYYISYVCTPQ